MELKNLKNKIGQKLAVAGGSVALATQSFAAGTDFTSLTTAVDFSSAVTAVLSVGTNIMLVYVAIKGFKIIVSAVRG